MLTSRIDPSRPKPTRPCYRRRSRLQQHGFLLRIVSPAVDPKSQPSWQHPAQSEGWDFRVGMSGLRFRRALPPGHKAYAEALKH